MANVSKTVLLDFEFTRLGAPFAEVSARSDIDSKNFDFTNKGQSFWGEASTSTPVYVPLIFKPTRLGAPFKEVTANPNIDASGFDFTNKGQSFYVYFSGVTPPPSYISSQFFIMF